jgi:hypothetical protein
VDFFAASLVQERKTATDLVDPVTVTLKYKKNGNSNNDDQSMWLSREPWIVTATKSTRVTFEC